MISKSFLTELERHTCFINGKSGINLMLYYTWPHFSKTKIYIICQQLQILE